MDEDDGKTSGNSYDNLRARSRRAKRASAESLVSGGNSTPVEERIWRVSRRFRGSMVVWLKKLVAP